MSRWKSLLERDKKNVAKISRFLDKQQADREANPALINDPAYWDMAEQGIWALNWIQHRPMYSDEAAMAHPEVAAFDQQVHDLIHTAQRRLFTGSSTEAEIKERRAATWADWDLAGIPDEFDIWLEQSLEVGEQRYLEERRRGRVSPSGMVR